jgi:nucleotide-binding universal stress UspA family protein
MNCTMKLRTIWSDWDMTTRDATVPLWRIFHPSDFSPASTVAFAHALKLALVVRGELTMLHVAPDAAHAHWSEFPGIRDTLARWGLLRPGSPPESVADLGIEVEKVIGIDSHPLGSIRRFLETHPADLILLATHQHHGLDRWLHHAVAEPLARASGALTLFVPPHVSGFVSLETGEVALRRVLVPIDRIPAPEPAVKGAVALAAALGATEARFHLLHIGDVTTEPEVSVTERAGWSWERTVRSGDPVEEILRASANGEADLIVMTTQGHADFLDALRGSTTEQVLRGARCPVLAIPEGTRRLEAMLAGS